MVWVECNHLGGKRGETSHGFPFLVRESQARAAHQLCPIKNTAMPSVSSNEEPVPTPDDVIWRAGDLSLVAAATCKIDIGSFRDIHARPARLEYRNRDGQGGLNGWSV